MSDRLTIKVLSEWGIPYSAPFCIAGPCSAESEEQVMQTALGLKDARINVLRAGIWKPRTRPGCFEGVGEVGLKWLKTAGKEINVPVTTEVATPEHVEACLKNDIDILWVGARTTSNPFAVQAIADALKGVDIPVIVKNPINPDLELWAGALERIHLAGIKRLAGLHRGFSTHEETKFRNQPIWKIPIELKRRFPIIPLFCDPSHICGNRELLGAVAQNAMDLLFDGLMIEVHVNPTVALSDAKQQVTPEDYIKLIDNIKVKQAFSSSLHYVAHISSLRKEVDEVDEQMLKLMGKRMEIVKVIALHKMRDNISIFQPDRWKELMQSRLKIGVEQKLSEGFIIKMYQDIHEESLRQQQEVRGD
ncbi:MAG: bifunctional 3-deoxy-7-phosphoheptulonate synthase/chorismate mutase type II [bacterium]|nr:bifunctional 3-deoxy-7-phosphoheptulonate synthase/chorismate mutase type II [bacterium]